MASGNWGHRTRCWAMLAFKWLFLAGYAWDWLLAAVLVWVNFNIPGIVIPAVERMYFKDDPNLRYPRSACTQLGCAVHLML